MKVPLQVALVWVAAATLPVAAPVAAADADCVRARDQHVDFKAVLDADPRGRPQFETVEHGHDGIVTIARWVNGEKRVIRKTLHGAFGKVVETLFGRESREVAFSPSIDLAKLFPLHAGQTAEYRVAIALADRFEPKFADVNVAVGSAPEFAIGGCKLQALQIVIDWRSKDPAAPLSKSTIIYAPALEYPVEFSSHITMRDKVIDSTTKVRAIEAWNP